MSKSHLQASPRLNIEVGVVIFGQTVTGVGRPVSGHLCWAVQCNFCRAMHSVRDDTLSYGKYRCACDASRGELAGKGLSEERRLIDALAQELSRALDRLDALQAQVGALTKV